MRLSVVLLCVSLLGVLAGGWLIGRWAFGLCVIGDSVAVGAWALLRDDDQPEAPPRPGGTLYDVLERARRAG